MMQIQNSLAKLLWEYKRRFGKMMEGFVKEAGESAMVTLAQARAWTDQCGENVKCVKWSQEEAGLVARLLR